MSEAFHNTWLGAGELHDVASASVFTTVGGSDPETDSTAAATERPVRNAGTIRNMGIMIGGTNNQTSNGSMDSHISGSAGNLSITVSTSDTNTYLEDTSSSDTIAASDEIAYNINNGTGGGYGIRIDAIEFDADTGCVTLMGINSNGSTALSANSTDFYFPVMGSRDVNTTETLRDYEVRVAGTWEDLAVRTGNNARTTDSVVTSRVSGLDGNQGFNVTASDDNVWLEETSASDTLTAGDDIAVEVTTGTGGSAFNVEKITSSFVSSGRDALHCVHGNDERINDGLTRYWAPRGVMAENSDETLLDPAIRYGATWQQLTVHQSENTGSVTATYISRVNAGDGNQSVVLSAVGRGTDTSSSDTLNAGDEINWQISSPVGGTRTATQYIGGVLEADAAATGAQLVQHPLVYHRHNLTR